MPSKGAIAIIIVTAIFFDVLQALLTFFAIGLAVAPIIINPFAQLILWFLFRINGVSYLGMKRLAIIVGGSLLEFIPVVDILPAFTFEAVLIVLIVKAEEKVANIIPGGKQVVRLINQKYTPYSKGGLRKEMGSVLQDARYGPSTKATIMANRQKPPQIPPAETQRKAA